MQTRMRAVSRVRNILAPDLECLEDRRLLSLLSQGAGSGELSGRPADQRNVDSASSTLKAPMDSQVQASQISLTGSPLTARVAASSTATSAGPAAAGKSAAEPKSVSAPDDGNIDAQSGSAEPDEASGPRSPGDTTGQRCRARCR